MLQHRVGLSGSGYGYVVGCCGHGDELSGYIEVWGVS